MANEEEPKPVITLTESSALSEDLADFYLSETFSDIKLVLSDQDIHAHKIVLATKSKFFKSLLLKDPKQTELILNDVRSEVFRTALEFIYTGSITITNSDKELIFDLLKLANKYSLKSLETSLITQISSTLNLTNVCQILNKANLSDNDKLKDTCHAFIDKNVADVSESDFFNALTQESIIGVLERDEFPLLEIDVFKIVVKWSKAHEGYGKLVASKVVRLGHLSENDILNVVWPTGLVDDHKLFTIFAAIKNGTSVPGLSDPRRVKQKDFDVGVKIIDQNIASSQLEAEIISENKQIDFLQCNRDIDKCCRHTINDQKGIEIKLGRPYHFNHIEMKLKDSNSRCYKYYIEVSFDQKNWKTVIDYRSFLCRSVQKLFFETQVAQYIRIVGTFVSVKFVSQFELVYFEAYFKSLIPKFVNEIVCLESNIATLENGAILAAGNFGSASNFSVTYHVVNNGRILIQLAQPYLISTIIFYLRHNCKYLIETSTDKSQWETAVDRTNTICTEWQNIRFKEKPVVFINIKGVYTSDSYGNFFCEHFECFF